MSRSVELRDELVRLTPARVRFEAGGNPPPLDDLLRFQADHAAARDAIHGHVDWDAVAAQLAPLDTLRVASRATDRATYLRRPDLGRQLAGESRLPRLDAPLLIVLGDGLSAQAVTTNGPGLVRALTERLPELAQLPVILAEGARVALGDQIGMRAGAEMVLMLIGERPGLTVADSLGAYLTLAPRVGLRDNARNCVSNIHGNGGLSARQAADRIAWLIHAARKLGQTGVALKDDSSATHPALTGRTDKPAP